MPIVLAAFGKLMPPEWRSTAFGIGTAAASFGQFLFSPLAVVLLGSVGWQNALLIYACIVLLVLPLSIALASRGQDLGTASSVVPQSFRDALSEAFGHGSYVLLVLGFFTCGFHVAFITTHLPPYLVDKGLDASWGGWVVAFIGLFNIVGSLAAGVLGGRLPKRYLLSFIYFSRTIAITWFLLTPVTPWSAMIFGGCDGPVLAIHGSAHLGSGRADVRHALHGDAVRLCVLLPSGRFVPRRVARRFPLRADRFI